MKRKKQRKGKQQIVSRRDMLKWGVLSGSAVLLSAETYRAISQSSGSGTGAANFSPATRPWIVPLAIPITKASVAVGALGAPAPNGRVYPQIPLNATYVFPPGHPQAGQSTGFRISPTQQRITQFPPQKYYLLDAKPAKHNFHPDLTALTLGRLGTDIWGYDGIFPGPTFKSTYKQPLLVRVKNSLSFVINGQPFQQVISTHLHNGHTASESDGFPCDFYPLDTQDPERRLPSGVANPTFRDHHYAMFRAGLPAGTAGNATGADGDPKETLSTLWYHDHANHHTAENVYRGLAGFHLFFDNLDAGDETKAGTYRLPSGNFDIPLMLADKLFDNKGQLFLDPFNHDGLIGDKIMVNGKIQPYLNVQRRRYRFRILDSGPSRFYQLYLTKNNVDQPFTIIGHDESLLADGGRPQNTGALFGQTNVRFSVGERADIVIDFKKFNAGDVLYLVNRLVMRPDGRGPTGDILSAGQGDLLLKFVVQAGNPVDPSWIPKLNLNQPGAVPPAGVVNMFRAAPAIFPNALTDSRIPKRLFRFDRSNGMWTVNNRIFECDNNFGVTPKKQQGAGANVPGEVWIFQGNSGGWAHPIHPHHEEFQILQVIGGDPQRADEFGKADVVELSANQEIKVFIRFRDFPVSAAHVALYPDAGKYPMHCHNVLHEDHDMMIRFDIQP